MCVIQSIAAGLDNKIYSTVNGHQMALQQRSFQLAVLLENDSNMDEIELQLDDIKTIKLSWTGRITTELVSM